MSIKRIIVVNLNEINTIVEKKDAIIVYLNNGKFWVCEQVAEAGNFYKLTLKGKSEKQ